VTVPAKAKKMVKQEIPSPAAAGRVAVKGLKKAATPHKSLPALKREAVKRVVKRKVRRGVVGVYWEGMGVTPLVL
jgi:hypothetical protein